MMDKAKSKMDALKGKSFVGTPEGSSPEDKITRLKASSEVNPLLESSVMKTKRK